MRRLIPVALAALMMAVAGCSGSPSAVDTPSPTQLDSSATPSDPTPPATPAPAAPAANCLDGRYRLVRIVGVGDNGIFGTGEGGDVAVTFDDGAYVLRGAGEDPITLTRAGVTVDLLVDGSISGDYHVEGTNAIFTLREGTGSATLSVGPLEESVSMEQVGNTLTQNGEAGLACANDALIVTLEDVRLELGKV
jgi:hypothetical protein